MMDDVLSLQRRGFLQVGAVVLATVAPGRAMAARSAGGSVVVYRADDAASVAFAAAMRAQAVPTFALGDDVVRQWRDELQALVVGKGYRMMGRTGYADWFMLRGLAAEHRIFPQLEQQPGPHSFDWVI